MGQALPRILFHSRNFVSILSFPLGHLDTVSFGFALIIRFFFQFVPLKFFSASNLNVFSIFLRCLRLVLPSTVLIAVQ